MGYSQTADHTTSWNSSHVRCSLNYLSVGINLCQKAGLFSPVDRQGDIVADQETPASVSSSEQVDIF